MPDLIKTTPCPGKFHVDGTVEADNATKTKTGVCSFCEIRVPLDWIRQAPLQHVITVTIH